MIGWFKTGLVVVFRTVLAVALVFVQAPLASQAQVGSVGAGRLALVIGNSNYQHIPTLKNPERDAQLISATLRDLGFDVIEKTDLDRKGFEAAVSEALDKAADKDAVLFYFAGHGFQLAGRNYLVPTDATLTDKGLISQETLSLDGLISRLQSRDRQTLLLLDACRNNPLPQSSRDNFSTDGLAQVETGSGTFVAFATQPGNITNDGAGANSPFSVALAEHMPTEGISISDMMIRVRNTVEETTLDKQTPWDQSSLRSQFYFNPLTEDSDALTAEDLELLAELDPELLEKFKKRFGLNFDNSDGSEAQGEMVATVVPALRIEAADEPAPEIASVEPSPAPGLEVETSIRAAPETSTEIAAPEIPTEIAMPEMPTEIEAPEMPTDIAALDTPDPQPGLLISPGLMISAATEEEAPVPDTAADTTPGVETTPAVDTVAAVDPSVVDVGSDTANLDAEANTGAFADAVRDDPAFTVPIPLQRPEPEIEIALADPRPMLDSVPAPVAGPIVPAPDGSQLTAPASPAIPLVTPPEAPEVDATEDVADPVADPVIAPLSKPAPKMIIAAPDPRPETIVPAVPEARDIAAQMPAFEPSVELSKAPAIVPGAPDLVEQTTVTNTENKAIAAAPPVATLPAATLPAPSVPSESSAPRLTPTPTHTPVVPETPVELAALDLAKAGPGELEALPESPLPDPAPVVDLEEQKRALATRAQSELERLGCYRSAIDGDWGPKSARALLRYYAEQKLTPDEIEPTEALISMLSAQSTVVCKTTVKATPTQTPARKKSTAGAPPVSKKQPQAAKPVAKRSSPAKTTAAAAPTSKSKKLKSGSMIGAFR